MPITTADFDYVRTQLRQRSAIVLEPGKEYLVESRIGALARSLGMDSVSSLVRELQRGKPGLMEKVVEAMTTSETSFFRDVRPFDTLRTEIVPQLIERRGPTRTLDIWSAACSSGQEPYTIAMTLREHFPELTAWTIRILATDLSTEILAQAKEGSYSQIEVNRGLPSKLLVKYFERHGTRWVVGDELRKQIDYRPLNLVNAWPEMRPLDIVFIRNVLSSFDLDTNRQILDNVKRVLKPDGFLFLGATETTMGVHDGYERLPLERSGVYRPVS